MSRYATISELSPRELEVAGLVAEGLSNPAIARRLYLSRPTIAHHVAHILTKLGLPHGSRSPPGWPAAQRRGWLTAGRHPAHGPAGPCGQPPGPCGRAHPMPPWPHRCGARTHERSTPMTSEATSHLDLTLMLAFHDAFRRDLAHLAHTASRRPAELDEPTRHTAVQAGWELFTTQLHIHHTVDALAIELHRHLTHEERDVLPLIDQSLSQAEWQAFGNDQRRRTGIRHAAQLFPWLLDAASPQQIQAVLGGLPAPLRVVYRRIWQPRYARHDHWEPSTQP